MDIEHLTKTQIVLLVLLVSFVTSMATGIVTVSLMDQAPEGVTYTINRFIEQSAEAVTGVVTQQQPEAPETTVSSTKTVADVVKEVEPSLVRIYTSVDGSGEMDVVPKSSYVGLGVIALDGRTIVSVASDIVLNETYDIRFSDGISIPARVIVVDKNTHMSLFSPILPDGYTLPAPSRAVTSKNLRLGQALMVLGGDESTELITGLLTSVPDSGTLQTNILANRSFLGGLIVTSSGASPGIAAVSDAGEISVIPYVAFAGIVPAVTSAE